MAAVTTNVALRADSSGPGRGQRAPAAEQYSSVHAGELLLHAIEIVRRMNRTEAVRWLESEVQRLEALAADLRTLPRPNKPLDRPRAGGRRPTVQGCISPRALQRGTGRASAVGAPAGTVSDTRTGRGAQRNVPRRRPGGTNAWRI